MIPQGSSAAVQNGSGLCSLQLQCGPAPAKRWQSANSGLDQDVAVEEISYWETREYVKRVLGNYWVYRELWN